MASGHDEDKNVIKDIIITHFINPSMFWYRVSAQIPEELLKLDQQILKHFSKNKVAEYKPKINEKVAVFIVSESRYCRAIIQEIIEFRQMPNKYMAWAVDYGKVYSTQSKYIRELPAELASVKIENVFFGGLNNLVPAYELFDYREDKNILKIRDKWSPETCKLFSDIINDAYTLDFVVQRKINDQFFGELMAAIQTNKTISINKVLLKSRGAMESDKFIALLNDLKLNKRSFCLTNENDIYKYNKNVYSSDCSTKLNEIQTVMLSDIDNDDEAIEIKNISDEAIEMDEDEIAITQKINEWNMGNARVCNENIEQFCQLRNAMETTKQEKIEEFTQPKALHNGDFSNEENGLLNRSTIKNSRKCDDPFDTNNLPLKTNVDNTDKVSIFSNLSSESKTERMSARQKILERARNRLKTPQTDNSNQARVVVPAGYDMRNLQGKKKLDSTVSDTKNVGLNLGAKAKTHSRESNNSNVEKSDSGSCMSESVNEFLRNSANAKRVSNISNDSAVSNKEKEVTFMKSEPRSPEKTFFLNSRKKEVPHVKSSPNNSKSEEKNQTNDSRLKKYNFEQKKDMLTKFDEICVPTSALGKASVMVHSAKSIVNIASINRLADAHFTNRVHNTMEALGYV